MSETKAFFDAVQSGNASAVRIMIDADSSLLRAVNERGQSALLVSIYHGRGEIRDFLLARVPALELHEAAAAGKLARVRELVAGDRSLANTNSPDGFPVVALAAFFGHLEVAQFLASQGADINAAATNGSGYNSMTAAVTGGHTEIVRWLLEGGADPNYRYGPGFTPLLAAAANGHLEIVKMLLGHKADVHAASNDGKTALAYAEERKHTAVAEYLRAY